MLDQLDFQISKEKCITLKIEQDKVVTFFYNLNDADGSILESSADTHPVIYLHGHNNILSGLEQALTGKIANDELTVKLLPHEAYGPRHESAVQKVPIKHLVGKHKHLAAGTFVKVNTQKGVKDATIVKAGRFMVTIDMNHPFAGKTLEFNIKVGQIREATSQELTDGQPRPIDV